MAEDERWRYHFFYFFYPTYTNIPSRLAHKFLSISSLFSGYYFCCFFVVISVYFYQRHAGKEYLTSNAINGAHIH